jgi:hypothetical protein
MQVIPLKVVNALMGGGLEPPDPITAAGLLPTAFGSSIVSGAPLEFGCIALGLPPPEPLGPATAVASAATFNVMVVASSVAFAVASSTAFAATASSMAFFTAVAYSAAFAAVASSAAFFTTAASLTTMADLLWSSMPVISSSFSCTAYSR